jgi:uncharacterized membrane protein
MAAQFCPQCGTPATASDRFCRTCGGPLTEATIGMPRDEMLAQGMGADPRATDFGVGDAIGFGWRTTLKSLPLLIGLTIGAVVIRVIQTLVVSALTGDRASYQLLDQLVSLATNTFIGIVFVTMGLKLYDGEPITTDSLMSRMNVFLSYLGTSILYGLIVFVGFLLLIVPGIIWAIKFGFSFEFVVDKGYSPMDALRASSRATSGFKWTLFGLGLASFGIIILGLIALVVGILVAAPVVFLAWIFAYRRLAARSEPQQLSPQPQIFR